MAKGAVTQAAGFLAAGIACGLKRSGKRDLALIHCPGGATAAAMFTTNKIVSAAVDVARRHARNARIYAVVINSGNANACTGQKGIKDAIAMCQTTAKHVGAEPHHVLVASTGIIGHPLPIAKVKAGIASAAAALASSTAAGQDFARAIMTTDTRCKEAVGAVRISGKDVTIGGTAKGAGMIGPNMATTISVITTDAAISKSMLQKAMAAAVGSSLNKLTVDGHQSTNDTAVVLASGAAGNPPITRPDARYRAFAAALMGVCEDLTRQMALDAEGATRMFKVIVAGAATQAEAAKAARAVADYDLVKCAVHGGDPNWGRIICAVGSCGVRLDEKKLACKIGDIGVFAKGRPIKFDAAKVSDVIRKEYHTITIQLGAGNHTDFCYGCDLSRGYVTINADYHT
ncbi:MAG: bifunctional glutamate N-acetyltransferase/amino-acid acetyltransferase ArgJ [Phycisphaerae bacterium]|nr:bifunctional glutamate N-acetyltransferase/amino-acid acetyltransferase ArgJ [Phycisphaerae bacterium]